MTEKNKIPADQEQMKKNAGNYAIKFVKDDMVVGVGTGSTVRYFIDELAKKKNIISGVVSSSLQSTVLLKQYGIPILDLNSVGEVDIYVDGADEINYLKEMIKGGGGALTQEKIIAECSRKFICIADESKYVKQLGNFPLPVEVISMARSYVARQIVKLGGIPNWREGIITDNGNVILDIHNLTILKPIELEFTLNNIVGSVSNGLFARRGADVLVLAKRDGKCMNTDGLLATIDLGSNSFRLLIAKIGEDQILKPIDQIKETVRLAGGLDDESYLNSDSQIRALETLSRFKERLVGFNQNQVRVVATSTLRIAKNAIEFIKKANNILGFKIEIISGNEEARLIYIGAMHSLSYSQEKRLVVDIGGGSTEFIIGCGYKPQIMESVTMGCVSMSMRYFADSKLNEKNFTDAILVARGKIQAMEHLFVSHNWRLAIGTSGTAQALYDLCRAYGFSEQISRYGLLELKRVMIQHYNIDKLSLVGIKEERKPVIAGGLSIMLAIFEELNIDEMTIADGSLREGVMYDFLGRKSDDDLRLKTIIALKKKYSIDMLQSQRVAQVASQIYCNLVDTKLIVEEQLKLLQWATELYEIGLSISHNDYHKHGAYILANSDIAGFSRPEQTMLADLVRSHRGNLFKAINHLDSGAKINTKWFFMVISFRLSVIFNRSRKVVDSEKLVRVDNISVSGFNLTVDANWLNCNPLTLHSLKEEFLQWNKFDIYVKLISGNIMG